MLDIANPYLEWLDVGWTMAVLGPSFQQCVLACQYFLSPLPQLQCQFTIHKQGQGKASVRKFCVPDLQLAVYLQQTTWSICSTQYEKPFDSDSLGHTEIPSAS